MTIPDRREDSPSACFQADARLAALAASPSAPTLDVEGTRKVEAWFLGPRGENAEEFERLVVDALRDHVYWRRNYHPGDPSHITEEIKREPFARDCLKVAEKVIVDLHLIDGETLQSWRDEAAAKVEEAITTAQKEPAPDGRAENWCAISTRELVDPAE